MFRFTIRDVLWLTVVVALLSLRAAERRWRSLDWPRIQRNEAARNAAIERQAERMQMLNARLAKELARRIDTEPRLADTPNLETQTASP
jgi:hypothetical protein